MSTLKAEAREIMIHRAGLNTANFPIGLTSTITDTLGRGSSPDELIFVKKKLGRRAKAYRGPLYLSTIKETMKIFTVTTAQNQKPGNINSTTGTIQNRLFEQKLYPCTSPIHVQ